MRVEKNDEVDWQLAGLKQNTAAWYLSIPKRERCDGPCKRVRKLFLLPDGHVLCRECILLAMGELPPIPS
jgi:hypothetical protein